MNFLERNREIFQQAELLFPTPSCPHPRTERRCQTKANGTKAYVEQCLDCGHRVGNEIPHSDIRGTVPDFDKALKTRHEAFRTELFEKRRAWIVKVQHEDRQKEADLRRNFYESYLTTPDWRRRREKILKRANGICEGCLSRNATQVHHLSYDHLGNEFAFELIAICDVCHARVHSANPSEVAA